MGQGMAQATANAQHLHCRQPLVDPQMHRQVRCLNPFHRQPRRSRVDVGRDQGNDVWMAQALGCVGLAAGVGEPLGCELGRQVGRDDQLLDHHRLLRAQVRRGMHPTGAGACDQAAQPKPASQRLGGRRHGTQGAQAGACLAAWRRFSPRPTTTTKTAQMASAVATCGSDGSPKCLATAGSVSSISPAR